MSKPLRILLLLGGLALALAMMALLGHNSGSRAALQKYKAELRAKGEKLTFEELMGSHQTSLTDSLIRLTNAIARLAYSSLSPGSFEPRKFVGPGEARVLWKEDSPLGVTLKSNSLGTGWQYVATQMETYGGSLEEIREALKDPAPDWGPRTNVWSHPIPNFVAIRVAAQWLMGTTLNELHQGRLEQALENLEALAALARLNRDEWSLVSQMIRVAVAGLGLSATWEALQAPGWTDPQLARLQKAWEAVDLAQALENGFLGERVGGAELFRMARQSGNRPIRQLMVSGSKKVTLETVMEDYVLFPAYKITSIDEDELFHLRSFQESIETIRSFRAHRPWVQAKQDLDKIMAEVNRISASPGAGLIRYRLSGIAIPNFFKALQSGVRAETERRMTITAIALKRFDLVHGKFPPALESLVPEFCSELPPDPMSGKAFGYQLKADGSFALYSVGEDGQDDGGDATVLAGGKPGLWEARDAVWPSPEK
jgi:hypothetical protein